MMINDSADGKRLCPFITAGPAATSTSAQNSWGDDRNGHISLKFGVQLGLWDLATDDSAGVTRSSVKVERRE